MWKLTGCVISGSPVVAVIEFVCIGGGRDGGGGDDIGIDEDCSGDDGGGDAA